MKRKLFRSLALLILVVSPLHSADAQGRRLEVLFLGDDGHHKPIDCYRILKQNYGPKGIDLTFIEDLKQITPEKLNQYDVLVVYANHEKDVVPAAIKPWVEAGGALVALHSAVGCFHPSQDWFALAGGQFASHEGREVTPKTIDKNHPITKDLPTLTSWDETYVHKNLASDRHVLQVREPSNKGETEPEPWTWTRNQGKGRVFYTASGHDMRCWSQAAYQELVLRGIIWTANERAAEWKKLKLPELVLYTPEIEGRTHPEIPMMQLQKPLSPADSAKHAQIPVGTRLELYAAEPLVIKPIAIDWDLKGRAWVVEALDYPNDAPKDGKGHDRIVILEDTDGDGKADKRTVFADGLKLGTALTFYRGGVIATDGEEVTFLKDEDGDDVADTRKVLATGFSISDTHACTSHFYYGADNWIYATVGYSGIDVKAGDEQVKYGSCVFRFRPDFSKLEPLQGTTNNTWGLGFTDDGDVMGSTANNNQSWVMSIPDRYYQGTPFTPSKTPRADTSTFMYPITKDFTQVDQIERYTAGAGHEFYQDEFKGLGLDGNDVMVCEPTGHVVGLGRIRPEGSVFATDFRGNNLYASADAWSAPVAARTGPDGAVWIADWYNPIVQHNVVFRFYNPARAYDQPHSPYQTGPQKPGIGNAYVTPLRDRSHGRIWRVVPEGGVRKKLPVLDSTKPASLITALSHPSRSWRLDAQRLLVERGNADVAKDLITLTSSDNKLAATHAIWTLEGLGLLQQNGPALDAVRKALDSTQPLVVRHALQALTGRDPGVAAALPKLLASAQSSRERLFTLLAATEAVSNDAIGVALAKALAADGPNADPTLRQAFRLATLRQAIPFLTNVVKDLKPSENPAGPGLLPNASFEQADGNLPAGGWRLYQWQPGGEPRVTTAIEPGHNGNALRITSTEATDTSVGIVVNLPPGTRYRFSGSIKAENLKREGGQGALLNLHGGPGSQAVFDNKDWTRVGFDFTVPDNGRCQLNCVFGAFGKATGTARFDNLKLEQIGYSLENEAAEIAAAASVGPDAQRLEALLATAPASFTALVRERAASQSAPARAQKVPAALEAGQALYQKVCIECHQPDGKGVPATFPPLAGSEWVKGDRNTILRIMLGGLSGKISVAGVPYDSIMPGHFHHTDEEIASIANYVRYQFGGLKEEPIKAEDVKPLRAPVEARKFVPWTEADLKAAAK